MLSGLIKKKEYGKADEYINKLHISSQSLATISSTGNAILDILVRGKNKLCNTKWNFYFM